MAGLRRWRRDWNTLGERHPLGAILTGTLGQMPEWNVDEFFATGRADVARFLADLDHIAPHTARGRALDFGCGVGRVTRALAAGFDSVTGVDVARSMIRRARALNRDVANCRFVVNRWTNLRRFATGSFDVVYSRLVLQHIPPEGVRKYVPELLRILAAHGVLMFQLPEEIDVEPESAFLNAPVTGSAVKRHAPRALVRAYRRLKYRWIVGDRPPRMEMYGLPQEAVLSLLAVAGGRVLAVRPDQSHGPGVHGFEYWVTRRN